MLKMTTKSQKLKLSQYPSPLSHRFRNRIQRKFVKNIKYNVFLFLQAETCCYAIATKPPHGTVKLDSFISTFKTDLQESM